MTNYPQKQEEKLRGGIVLSTGQNHTLCQRIEWQKTRTVDSLADERPSDVLKRNDRVREPALTGRAGHIFRVRFQPADLLA